MDSITRPESSGLFLESGPWCDSKSSRSSTPITTSTPLPLYLSEDYRLDAHGLNVIATVHVEAEYDRAHPVDETAWLHRIHERHGMPNAIVAHAFLHQDRLEELLLSHKRYPLTRGIRSKPVTARTARDACAPRRSGLCTPAGRGTAPRKE